VPRDIPANGAAPPILQVSLGPAEAVVLLACIGSALQSTGAIEAAPERSAKALLDGLIDYLFAIPAHQLPGPFPHQSVERWRRWRACTTLPLPLDPKPAETAQDAPNNGQAPAGGAP
jgi:hypothetical protein